MNLHGGGFTLDAGSQTENIPIAALTGRKIVAVRYRLSPEHPYPAGIDDAMAVYKKLLETYEPRNIIVYGTSAGATMTAQLAVRLKRDGLPMPAALGMFSLISDFSRYGESMMGLNPLIPPPPEKDLAQGKQDLIAQGNDLKDPMLSPLFADLAGLPPTLLMSGTRDLLLSQTIMMQMAMYKAGDDAQLVVFEGMMHAHWAYLDLPESREAFELQARFFEQHLAANNATSTH
nr:alpha/beta hydrolase [Solimonas terrae]